MAGRSGKPLAPKLGIGAGHRVALVDAALAPELTTAARALPRGAMLCGAWPRRASRQATDLTEDVVPRLELATGLVDVKVSAVDEVWSGLEFLRRRVTS